VPVEFRVLSTRGVGLPWRPLDDWAEEIDESRIERVEHNR
jgi:hypothetical protein